MWINVEKPAFFLRRKTLIVLCTIFATVVPLGAVRGEAIQQEPSGKTTYSPPARQKKMTNLYWGDTHLHTSASADAYTMGGVLTRDDAYRFAMGQTVTAENGMKVKLRRPLDFLAVTDHAEYLGIFRKLEDENSGATKNWPLGRKWAEYIKNKQAKELGLEFAEAIQSTDPKYAAPQELRYNIWKEVAETADKYNKPGCFTAFTGYEWTSMIGGDNLHRVVIFKDGKDKTTQLLPFTAQHSTDPEKLWDALEKYEAATGGEVLAIAHNGNVSNGRMFSPLRVNGEPLDKKYAADRARWEPVYEVTQVKGDGEAHPKLSPTDEFADFETWDEGNIMLSAPKKPEMLPYEYARPALAEGLKHEAKLGVNPFKFGMIGSTDIHNGLSSTEEDNFFGKFGNEEPRADRYKHRMAEVLQEDWQLVIGYEKGVPMGGDLTAAGSRKAPTFMVAAARDPDGANLDRIQIIKGWLDKKGDSKEKIYDIALSDGRRVDPETGKAPAVGSTIDLKNASYTNTIGAPELATVWSDPDFDPDLRAFYYVRVLEIPTPRWTAYDAKFFNVEMPEKIPMTVQDRAYTSPIWYTP